MKKKHYVVTFQNGMTVFTSCFNEEEAEILAKAIMIKNGFTREVQSILETKTRLDMMNTDFVG